MRAPSSMGVNMQLNHDMVKLVAAGTSEDVFLIGGKIEEELGRLPRMQIEFVSRSFGVNLDDLLGSTMTIEVGLGIMGDDGFQTKRSFKGTCITIENLGMAHGCPTFFAEVRPWLWFLTRMSNNTIYENMTAPNIIKQVMSDAGFSDVTLRLSGTYRTRIYTVQYHETHFDFISRLMEEEGIYYYFDYSGPVEKMVLTDGPGGHDQTPEKAIFKFDQRIDQTVHDEDELYDWSMGKRVATGKISLVDYDFQNTTARLKVTKILEKGTHTHKSHERFEMDGHYITAAEGEHYAQIRVQRDAVGTTFLRGEGNARMVQCGAKLRLEDHPTMDPMDGLTVSTVFYVKSTIDKGQIKIPGFKLGDLKIDFPALDKPTYVQFQLAPAADTYRAARTTTPPDLSGLHTAVVVGADGKTEVAAGAEKMATDEFGRIRVRFHWMTDTQQSCWARVASPWVGKAYGFYGIPRIGQEVIVQFERNNPDHPIVTGMLYNGTNTHPLNVTAQITKVGFKTQTSKDGTAAMFNEFTMDDKKDAEMVTLQSQKDYTQIIKNNATVTIGTDEAAVGDLTQTIKKNKTETIKEGDFVQNVETGNRTLTVKTDHTDTVEGKSTTTVTGNTDLTVKTGNFSETISTGHYTTTVDKGNITIKASAGQVVIEAAQSLELKVGGSSIKLTPASIDIKSQAITVDGKATTVKGSGVVKVEGAIGTFEASGILSLKGSIAKVN